MKAFTPRALLEGYTPEEVMDAVDAARDGMTDILGDDREAIVVSLSFMLGREGVRSKLTLPMILSMVKASYEIEVETP